MLSLSKRLESLHPCLRAAAAAAAHQLRSATSYTATSSSSSPRRRSRSTAMKLNKKSSDDKSEWWAVDGEMHEVGDNVPLRERFIIPRDNIPNKRRKQLREQFMRRTRLVLKESEHEPWCKKYMELYQELRENWERLYWDEGYSKKLAQDHANYESAEDDDQDFSPYRRRPFHSEQMKDQGLPRNRQDDTWNKVGQIRDKFEYDREKRMQQKAFAPMRGEIASEFDNSPFSNQPFNTQRYFPQNERNQ